MSNKIQRLSSRMRAKGDTDIQQAVSDVKLAYSLPVEPLVLKAKNEKQAKRLRRTYPGVRVDAQS